MHNRNQHGVTGYSLRQVHVITRKEQYCNSINVNQFRSFSIKYKFWPLHHAGLSSASFNAEACTIRSAFLFGRSSEPRVPSALQNCSLRQSQQQQGIRRHQTSPSINTRTNRSKMSTFEPVVRIPRYRTASARRPHDQEDIWKMVQNSNG